MTSPNDHEHLVEIDTAQPVWDRFFMVAPLVLVGTRDDQGDLVAGVDEGSQRWHRHRRRAEVDELHEERNRRNRC